MKIFLALFLCMTTLWIPVTYKRISHPFRHAKCYVNWPYVQEWETKADEAVIGLLQQPFSYLGKGKQSYVFESRDQKVVLKLFRFDLNKAPFGQLAVKKMRHWFGLRQKHDLPAAYKIVKNFNSCHWVYKLAKEQTGVIFAHLNPKPGLPMIRLKDRLGKSHTVDPNKYRFVLQKKAIPLLTALRNASDTAPIIENFSKLLCEMADLGLANLDPTMGKNFGVLGGRVILMDIGNCAYVPEKAGEQIKYYEGRLQAWVEKNLRRKGSE